MCTERERALGALYTHTASAVSVQYQWQQTITTAKMQNKTPRT